MSALADFRFNNSLRRRPEHHARQAMLTPPYVLRAIRALFGRGIGLDPCTESSNPVGAATFYSPPQDGCALPWDAPSVFCNPPYGQARDRWVDRCISEGRRRQVVLLIPAHTETRIFQRALAACDSVCLVRARLKFKAARENGRLEAASHGSALFGFSVDLAPLADLGVILRPDRSWRLL
jgi:DNA N-6-adenine-methyltransferase (Dam)